MTEQKVSGTEWGQKIADVLTGEVDWDWKITSLDQWGYGFIIEADGRRILIECQAWDITDDPWYAEEGLAKRAQEHAEKYPRGGFITLEAPND